MKKFIVLILCAMIAPAFAEDVTPVKDRCASPDVLVTVAKLLDKMMYPSKFADKGAFQINPDTLLTESYDQTLDKVFCRAHLTLTVANIDAKQKPWVNSAHKLGIAAMTKYVFFTMQFASGNHDHYNVRLGDIIDAPPEEK